jgi:hypothetical protein
MGSGLKTHSLCLLNKSLRPCIDDKFYDMIYDIF